jgi:tRNA-5-methyluridine54 2-sulfurtransferase
MNCSICAKPAVVERPYLCAQHFCSAFEQRVELTIKKYRLLKKNARILVAVSGGKDSLVTAFLLCKYAQITLLAIDEGIAGYRNKTLRDLQRFNKQFGPFPLKIVRFQDVAGKTLDQMLKVKGSLPCTVCGRKRREIMEHEARGFDAIATGHNQDDEAQAVLMNVIRGQLSPLQRIGPKTPERQGFVSRIKPLYFCSEKEVLTYAFLKGIQNTFVECPYAHESFRARVRDALNDFELVYPSSKRKVLLSFLRARMNKLN